MLAINHISALAAGHEGIKTNQPCDLTASTTINLKWNAFASETGLYEVDGCDGASPEIHLQSGQTYTFMQTDGSNWYHPVGFAYEPGGAHFDLPEVMEKGEPAGTLQYYVKDVAITDDESTFGLDGYEPLFFYPYEAWEEHGPFHVTLTVPDVTKLYYFCHIHAEMSANIVVHGASAAAESPQLHDEYFVEPPTISDFDAHCGTVGVSPYDGHGTCADKHFLCGSDLDSTFNHCLQAIDCKMHVEMAVQTDSDPAATFMRQMIPHHANAVSMAKVLLKNGGELSDEIKMLANSIINVQNAQIQEMQGYLDGHTTHYCYEDSACPPGCVADDLHHRRSLLFASMHGVYQGSCPTGCHMAH